MPKTPSSREQAAKMTQADDRESLIKDLDSIEGLCRDFSVIDSCAIQVESASAAESSRVRADSVAGTSDSELGFLNQTSAARSGRNPKFSVALLSLLTARRDCERVAS
ncbi:MAG TPA: hypothetical protein VES91_04025 [Burkholderiaceae bacterium]|nr:hypothetical protein [Burkholderiaceae bacterium]